MSFLYLYVFIFLVGMNQCLERNHYILGLFIQQDHNCESRVVVYAVSAIFQANNGGS